MIFLSFISISISFYIYLSRIRVQTLISYYRTSCLCPDRSEPSPRNHFLFLIFIFIHFLFHLSETSNNRLINIIAKKSGHTKTNLLHYISKSPKIQMENELLVFKKSCSCFIHQLAILNWTRLLGHTVLHQLLLLFTM